MPGIVNGEFHIDIFQDANWSDLTFTTEVLDNSIIGFALHANETVELFSDLSFGFYDDNGLIDSIDLVTQAGATVVGAPLLSAAQNLTITSDQVVGDLYGLFNFEPQKIKTILGTYANPLAAASTTYSFKSTVNSPVSAVPEPSTYLMMLGGLGLVGFMAARRRKQA